MSKTFTTCFPRTTERRSFSLAEFMIAILILGIGMIIVAASFPVGLDQSNIVTDTSLAPMVANEAFNTIQTLLHAPNPSPRIASETPASPYKRISFRQAIENYLSYADATYVMEDAPLTSQLLIDNDPSITDPKQRERNINDWLATPTGDVGKGTPELGCQTRYYPSLPGIYTQNINLTPNDATLPLYTWLIRQSDGKLVPPPYTWSTLYHRDGKKGSRSLQFVVFVSRRNDMMPARIQVSQQLGGPRIQLPITVQDSNKWSAGTRLDASFFPAGTILVDQSGTTCKVISTNTDSQGPFLEIDGNMGMIFWFIPPDATSGKSPLLAVYTRSYLLN